MLTTTCSRNQRNRPATLLASGNRTRPAYGHYVAFLQDDLQPACADELQFAESAAGYESFRLRQRLEGIALRHPAVDSSSSASTPPASTPTTSCTSYRSSTPAPLNAARAIAGAPRPRRLLWRPATQQELPRPPCSAPRSPDPIEARAPPGSRRRAARFHPARRAPHAHPAAGRRRPTPGRRPASAPRLINQFHHLLGALCFPELALCSSRASSRPDGCSSWSTATPPPCRSGKRPLRRDLGRHHPYLPDKQIGRLLEHARALDRLAERPGRRGTRPRPRPAALRDCNARQKRLEGTCWLRRYRAPCRGPTTSTPSPASERSPRPC